MLLLSSVRGEVLPVHTDTHILGCLGSFTCKGLIDNRLQKLKGIELPEWQSPF